MKLDPNLANPPHPKANKWIIANAIILILINLYLGFIIGTAEAKFGGDLFGLIAFVFGRAIIVPGAFVALYSISKKYRNNAARAKILMWGSVIILISSMGGLAKIGGLS
jgi:hypothetical protein